MAPGDDNPTPTRPPELHGWKEIAEHLNRSVRTAQRWEREFGLPVRRLRTAAGETVYAIEDELHAWKATVTLTREGRAEVAGTIGEENGDRPAPPPETRAVAPAFVPGGAASSTGARRRAWIGGGRLWIGAALSLALLAGTAGAAWLARAMRTSPSDIGGPSTLESVLDPGPWPTGGHDMQRTNQSHLRGPRLPADPVPIFELRGANDWPDELVSTMDGKIVVGGCGRLIALDRSGRELWQRQLRSVSGVSVHPGGIAVAAQANLLVTGHDCPNQPDLIETYLYEFTAAGAEARSRPIGSSFVAPAIGRGRVVYTLDETNYLRVFHPWMDSAGGTTLAGFLAGGIAVDGRGNLYAGTDGGRYHQFSLWSLAPDGEVRWRALKEELGQPAVGLDRVYAASLSGNVHALSLDGQVVWSRAVGTIASVQPLALAASGTLYVQTAKEIVAMDRDGTIRWRIGPGDSDQGRAHAVLDRDENGYAWIGGSLLSFDRDGKERWRLPFPPTLAIIVGEEGALYATTRDKRVFRIGERQE